VRFCFSVIIAVLSSCNLEGGHSVQSIGKKTYYEFAKPDEKYILGLELEEISGLSWNGNNSLACIQDEDGTIFIYNILERKVEKRIRFKGSGDFEGIERVGDWYYVLGSNGKIYKVPEMGGGPDGIEILNTPLGQKNDMEGLGLSEMRNILVLATKGKGSTDDEKFKGKGIYGFDLERNKFDGTPIFTIQKKMISRLFEKEESKRKDDGIGISGIALHPIEGNYYLISSEGKFLIVINPEGELLSYVDLPRKQYKQPEGICFDPKGNLYISNEAREGAANILFLRYQK
jgi:uncharacterized protein YjiK